MSEAMNVQCGSDERCNVMQRTRCQVMFDRTQNETTPEN